MHRRDMFQRWVTRFPRVVAGAWFAAAALLPVGAWFLPPILKEWSGEAFMLVILLPLAATALSGAWLGAWILQGRRRKLHAFLRGMGVALGAFVLLAPGYVIASLVADPTTRHSVMEVTVQTGLALTVGLLVTGWLFLPIGGLAGLLLQWMARRGG